jgi:hypothetical protein
MAIFIHLWYFISLICFPHSQFFVIHLHSAASPNGSTTDWSSKHGYTALFRSLYFQQLPPDLFVDAERFHYKSNYSTGVIHMTIDTTSLLFIFRLRNRRRLSFLDARGFSLLFEIYLRHDIYRNRIELFRHTISFLYSLLAHYDAHAARSSYLRRVLMLRYEFTLSCFISSLVLDKITYGHVIDAVSNFSHGRFSILPVAAFDRDTLYYAIISNANRPPFSFAADGKWFLWYRFDKWSSTDHQVISLLQTFDMISVMIESHFGLTGDQCQEPPRQNSHDFAAAACSNN